MVLNASALAVDPPPEDGLQAIDLQGLMESDWAAYDFANSRRGRELLGMPDGVHFHIEPRLLVEREYFHRGANGTRTDQKVGECLFKVWWTRTEENRLAASFPALRQIVVGTTMAWDRETGKLRVLLTSNPDRRPAEHAEQAADRDASLVQFVEEGFLRPGPQRLGPDGRPLRFAANVAVTGQVMRVSDVARTLHFRKEA